MRIRSGLTGARKHRAFLDIWTRKEAYTKAIGVGLQHPLRDLDLSAVDADPPVICASRADRFPAWRLVSLALAAGYVGTLAVQEASTAQRSAIHIRTFDSQFTSGPHFQELAQ